MESAERCVAKRAVWDDFRALRFVRWNAVLIRVLFLWKLG